jgi:hypothetical protein
MVENYIVSSLVGIQDDGNSISPITGVVTKPESNMLNENVMGILADNKGSISNGDTRRRSRLSGNSNIRALKIQGTPQSNIARDFEDNYSRTRSLNCGPQGAGTGIVQVSDFIDSTSTTGRSGNPKATGAGEDRNVTVGKIKGHAIAATAQAAT